MIFLNLLNKIFGAKRSLTRSEIDEYNQGKGNAYEVDLKTADSSFDNDALEGWEESGLSAQQTMSSLDEKMKNRLNQVKAPKNSFSTTLTLAFFSLTMLILIYFTYQGNQIINEQIIPTIELAENTNPIEEVEKFSQIPEEKQIKKEDLKEVISEESAKVIVSTKSSDDVPNDSRANRAEVETSVNTNESVNLPLIPATELESKKERQLVYHEAKEVYIHELKTVDYRVYRNRPIKDIQFDFSSGTPANVSFNEEAVKRDESRTQDYEIPYIDYLRASMEYFVKNDFKTALKRYLVILENYPDDVNANFYGGLCYFNLGQFERAIELFEKSYTIGYGNFREEAEWFMAKANYELNNMIRTKALLKKIIKEDGFYAEQAKELLIECK